MSTKSKVCLVQQFFSGTKDSQKDVRMLRAIPGVEPPWYHLSAFPDLLWLFAKCYFSLIWDQSHTKPTISTHHIVDKLDIGFISTCGRPSTPGIILNILTSFFESFVPEKKCWTRQTLLFADLLKHTESFWRFSQTDQKFEVGLLSLRNRQAKT